ncbi:UNVERIFIED_CONTAM: hypothetical protein Sradi_5764700 [Sesamum radiatum]|uniref:Protein downstream neighbor of Son n=1 Tax=Sesamum radiatum TaxID=300843 RepID=A0AAW2KNI5_SESRA
MHQLRKLRMTKVAAAGELPTSNALHFGGGAVGGGGLKIQTTTMKRKTPSELRGELLKRKNPVECIDESPSVTSSLRNVDGAIYAPKKSDSSKAPRFTRMDEHYPVTKTSRLLPRKEHLKETFSSKCFGSLKNSSLPVDFKAQSQMQPHEGGNNSSNQTYNSNGKYTSNTFKTVRELSQGGDKLNGSSSVDMGKALKGLVSCEPHVASAPPAEFDDKTGNVVPQSFCPEIHIPGHKIPLDLTLKTNMRFLSSSAVNWFHRLINSAAVNGMSLSSDVGGQGWNMTCSAEPTSTGQITNPGTFHSWVHPQSTLPRAVISALTSAPGGQVDFLSKRQQTWEDSFRSLYYMLRKNMCKIFYVCTMQFVVMFTAFDGLKKTKGSCRAYISQSTRNFRSLLKEHDVSFSMPLCRSKVEEVTAEDLVELSEIQKHNLGQARPMESMTGVDNTPQSLLMCTGSKNVHAIYDLLLNYRSFLTSLTGADVPVLYSPVPFQNAALSTPEVRCKQVRKVDYISSQPHDSNMDSEPNRTSCAGICYSVEIRDTYLPPWVICGICDAMRSNGGDYQASFATESMSIGLNVGLDVARDQTAQLTKADEPLQESALHPNSILEMEGELQSIEEKNDCLGTGKIRGLVSSFNLPDWWQFN